MPRIGLVTDALGLRADDVPLVEALAARGASGVAVRWDDDVDWAAFDALLIRTPWDYPGRWERFARFLGEVERAGVVVWNPLPVLRWNLHKTYLVELAALGLPVIPTVVLDGSIARHLARWGDVVVKPVVGSTGDHIWRVRRGDEAALDQRLASVGRPFLVQPFAPEVADGEVSAVFVAGRYSHAVRKRAARGEFRVHEEHGGTVERAELTSEEIEVAARFVEAVPWCPYARVDLIGRGAGVRLVELELIEPELFFRVRPEAATELAGAVLAGG